MTLRIPLYLICIMSVSQPTLGQPIFGTVGHLPNGDFPTTPSRVSADGQVVVGWSIDAGDGGEAFWWSHEVGMVGLGDLPPSDGLSTSEGVSADGSVVVGKGTSAESAPNKEAFRWTAEGGMVGLGDLPGFFYSSVAQGVSGDGDIVVGWSSSDLGSQAFRWTESEGMVGLIGLIEFGQSSADAISLDGTTVVGWAVSEFGSEAFRWTAANGTVGLGDLPGGSFNSRAWDVCADGSVVVGQGTSENGKEAFRWTEEGGMVGLGDLPGGNFDSRALGVSADGSIVVGHGCISEGLGCDLEPFVWDAEHGMRALRDVLVNNYNVDLTGWELKVAGSVSANGLTIIGSCFSPAGDGEAWIVRLPDCNKNGIADDLDIIDGTSDDADADTIPDECQVSPCMGDVNDDAVVDPLDLAVLLGAWGPTTDDPADLNQDGFVSANDLVILLADWGPCRQ